MNERELPAGDRAGHGLAGVDRGRRDLSVRAPPPPRAARDPRSRCSSASVLLLLGNIVALSRVKDFAWDRFFAVAKWSLLAYLLIAGMIEYAFLKDHVSGGSLVVLTLSLACSRSTCRC